MLFAHTCQRSLSSVSILVFCIFSYIVDAQSNEKLSFRTGFQLRHTNQIKSLLHIVYFREFDLTLDETRLKNYVRNLTDSYRIDLKVTILNQSTSLLATKLCSILSEEQRDTIFIADLYTKEIDLVSRSLQIPTIATINRYQILQGKLYNPYLFKLMPDAEEGAQAVLHTLDTRSIHTRVAIIYDTSLDMMEYRSTFLRLTKQHIVYQAHLPRISLLDGFRPTARQIVSDLIGLNTDLILCAMSTERELQFVRVIERFGTLDEKNRLLNQTSWWFASHVTEVRNLTYFPRIFTAHEERRRMIGSSFSSSTISILLKVILRTYTRLPISSALIGTSNCSRRQNLYQLKKTHTFIELLTNFTEWNCNIRLHSGIDPFLFEPKTLVWRIPIIFLVHREHSCQGILTRLFVPGTMNADQFFHSCRVNNSVSRFNSSLVQQENVTAVKSSSPSSNALVNLKNYHQLFGRDESVGGTNDCRFIHIRTKTNPKIIVGVAEPPYIFVSENRISSELNCNYGLPCYQIDPSLVNFTTNEPSLYSDMGIPPHCCYGISIDLLSRIEDSQLVPALKKTKLFVFSDKPKKWLALVDALKHRRAHLSISAIPHESFLARSIDLSPSFYHSSYVFLTVPKPTGPLLGAFLQPFSWAAWFMIFLVLNATALFETFFEWHSPYGLTPKGRRRHKVFSLASALTLSWSIIFSHTFKTKSPKCWSNRFLGNVWGGFGIVFIAIYTAKLAAFMVEMGRTHTASSIHNIVELCRQMPRCTVGVVVNTSDEEYLKRFYTETLYRHIYYISSYSQGIEDLKAYRITYLLIDHSIARYFIIRDASKSLRISEDNFGTFGLSLAFTRSEDSLKESITNILLSYVDKGIMQRLHDEWYVYENCETKLLNENRVLPVDRFIGVFMLLIAGMIIGLIVLLIEWVTFKYAVPYWRQRQWPGWLFCSQRLYAILNATDDVYHRVYQSPKSWSSRRIGERLRNHSTRHDSLDLHVIDIPRLLSTTYQLKGQINQITEQQRPSTDVKESLRKRIDELEEELTCLRARLKPISK